MRRLDGVNLKKSRFKRRGESPLILPKHKEKNYKHSHLDIGDGSLINLKNIAKSIVWLIILSVVFYVGNQALKTQKKLLLLQDSMEKSLVSAQDYAGNGNVEGSLSELNQLKSDITKSKLIAQAWGQDISFFQYLPGRKSSLTQKEVVLTTGYDVINLSEEIREDIGALQQNSISVASNGTYNVDLELIGGRVDKIVQKVNKKMSFHRKLLKGMNGEQAQKLNNNIGSLSSRVFGIESFLNKDLPWISGSDGKEKNMLLIFQNNGELRGGSGGSLGSFGTLKFKDGKLSDISFGTNIYKIDKAFKAETHVDPPEIIKFLNPDWVMKDAGWSQDGPAAFATIEDFYTKETGKSVDGVVVLDATFFENLLSKIGAVDLPQYGKTIDEKNFRSEIETEVHDTYFDRAGGLTENEPKKILGEMMPIVLNKFFKSLSDQEKFGGLLSVINGDLEQKHLLLYLNNSSTQKMIENANWSGSVRNYDGDYLYVNNSNIAGGKSSINVSENINLETTIGSDGNVSNKLNLERNYDKDNEDKDNLNFVRLGLPQNASVAKFTPGAGNFEQMGNLGYKDGKAFWQTSEFSKIWLNFWMTTKVGKKSSLEVNYTPGYKIGLNDDFTYFILIQKQPGSLEDTVTLKINFPEGYKPVNIKNYNGQTNSATIKLNLKSDLVIKIKFEQK